MTFIHKMYFSMSINQSKQRAEDQQFAIHCQCHLHRLWSNFSFIYELVKIRYFSWQTDVNVNYISRTFSKHIILSYRFGKMPKFQTKKRFTVYLQSGHKNRNKMHSKRQTKKKLCPTHQDSWLYTAIMPRCLAPHLAHSRRLYTNPRRLGSGLLPDCLSKSVLCAWDPMNSELQRSLALIWTSMAGLKRCQLLSSSHRVPSMS